MVCIHRFVGDTSPLHPYLGNSRAEWGPCVSYDLAQVVGDARQQELRFHSFMPPSQKAAHLHAGFHRAKDRFYGLFPQVIGRLPFHSGELLPHLLCEFRAGGFPQLTFGRAPSVVYPVRGPVLYPLFGEGVLPTLPVYHHVPLFVMGEALSSVALSLLLGYVEIYLGISLLAGNQGRTRIHRD